MPGQMSEVVVQRNAGGTLREEGHLPHAILWAALGLVVGAVLGLIVGGTTSSIVVGIVGLLVGAYMGTVRSKVRRARRSRSSHRGLLQAEADVASGVPSGADPGVIFPARAGPGAGAQVIGVVGEFDVFSGQCDL